MELLKRGIATQSLLQLAFRVLGRVLPERVYFGGSVSIPPRTPMYLYSNVGRSMVVGNQVTDLLREIPPESSKGSYEPVHIQYLPVRSDVIDIIELQVAENDGKLVEFSSGVTSVTLHFKHE